MCRITQGIVRWRVDSPQESEYLKGLLEPSGTVTTESRGSYFEVILVNK